MCFLIEGKYYEYTNENGFCDRGERKEAIKKDVNKIFQDEFGDRCVKEYDPDSEKGEDIDVIILDELENENWIFVVPLQHEAAVFMNSCKCGGAGGLESVSRNINHKSQNLKFFEVGNTYIYNKELNRTRMGNTQMPN